MSAFKQNLDQFKAHVKKRNWIVAVTALLVVLVTGINVALEFLDYEFADAVYQTTTTILFIFATFFIASLLNRFSVPWVKRMTMNAEVENRLLFSKLIGVTIFAVAMVISLWRLGVNGQNIALVLGFTATGFALSIRDSIASYLAWFVLLTKRPFRIHDNIRVEGIEGQVQHIGTFYVVIDETPRDKNQDFYKVPTVHFVQKPIRNFRDSRFQDTMTASFTKSRKWRSKLDKLREQLGDATPYPCHVSVEAQDKDFVVKVTYEYTLREKQDIKQTIGAAMFNVLATQPS